MCLSTPKTPDPPAPAPAPAAMGADALKIGGGTPNGALSKGAVGRQALRIMPK